MAYCALKPEENLLWNKETGTWVSLKKIGNSSFVSFVNPSAVVRSLHENGEDCDSVQIVMIH
jgi:hypothetical protein